MKEKKLDLLKEKDLTLNHGFYKDVTQLGNKYNKRYSYTKVSPFKPEIVEKDQYGYSTIIDGAELQISSFPGVTTTALDSTLEVTVEDVLKPHKLNYYSQIADIKKKAPTVYAHIMSTYDAGYVKAFNQFAVIKRETYKAKVQKQYDELLVMFKDLGSAGDLRTMDDINELYYCEAEGFMEKLETRIFKKSNPKNLRLYQKLQEIRDEEYITCNDQ